MNASPRRLFRRANLRTTGGGSRARGDLRHCDDACGGRNAHGVRRDADRFRGRRAYRRRRGRRPFAAMSAAIHPPNFRSSGDDGRAVAPRAGDLAEPPPRRRGGGPEAAIGARRARERVEVRVITGRGRRLLPIRTSGRRTRATRAGSSARTWRATRFYTSTAASTRTST